MCTFNKVIEKLDSRKLSDKKRGSIFEKLMKEYFLKDYKYCLILEDVYLWNEFPFKKQFSPGQDIGIDLVAKTKSNEYWAIQCKFYSKNHCITKKDIDTFLSVSSKFFYINNNKINFSQRFLISTTEKWSNNAEETIKNQHTPVCRINYIDLENSLMDWPEEISEGSVTLKKKINYEPKPHQQEAIKKSIEYFKTHDRGKLIMACGTGKTFTSLKISEKMVDKNRLICYLVPSIALLSQTLKEWTNQCHTKIIPICVCSDSSVSEISEDKDPEDLGYPVTTDQQQVCRQFKEYKKQDPRNLIVIFSTYQSIQTIIDAQNNSLPEFDFTVCDEAHRTTGIKEKNKEFKKFSKVHDNSLFKSKKRLYMTATPRIYSSKSKSKAEESDIVICSMDDPKIYGDEIYRIGFSKAVEHELLTDYRVLVLTVSKKDIPIEFQQAISNNSNEIKAADVATLVGIINTLSKNLIGDNYNLLKFDPKPMKRAVAYCKDIKTSKIFTDKLNELAQIYKKNQSENKLNNIVEVTANHVDGTMNTPEKNKYLSKLKNQSSENKCYILSNVRCLTEGVDVPALDAVVFLSPKYSEIDITQAIGRAMRRAPEKKYGYIIIPVVIPEDASAKDSLAKGDYSTVWKVINALRSHDETLTDNEIKDIILNKGKSKKTNIVGMKPSNYNNNNRFKQLELDLKSENLEKLKELFYAKLVKKVGDKTYYEDWAKDTEQFTRKVIEKLEEVVKKEKYKDIFDDFLNGLKKNVDEGISAKDAIEMLAQHIVTEPIFNSLFEDYKFIENNPVSIAMRNILNHLKLNVEKLFSERDSFFEQLYESVKRRVSGITNPEGRQTLLNNLYDRFFKIAFPKMSEQLGIVYTPIEIADFIINSVNDALKQEFNCDFNDEKVNIIDPFVGTGTFIVRLIQSGLINKENIKRKYNEEIFANEIVLLAYYIAAVNIENAFKTASENEYYFPFNGICLTDTFQTSEEEDYFSNFFPVNSKRIKNEKETSITVFMGNPPYSAGQKNSNDNNPNKKYPNLDSRVKQKYVETSTAQNKNSLYDSYIRAFRYSTDKLGNNNGVICYVTNGGWIDGLSMDGFRKSLENEFYKIYVFNLRGNLRVNGKESLKKEGGTIFGNSSRVPIAITLLLKKKDYKGKAKIFYRDIGDYLNREEKLQIVKDSKSFFSPNMNLKQIFPNKYRDWINQRNNKFLEFIPLNAEAKYQSNCESFFVIRSCGISTGRDSWAYNFSNRRLTENMKNTIEFYNSKIDEFKNLKQKNPSFKFAYFKKDNSEPAKIKWSSSLENYFQNCKKTNFKKENIYKSYYRPFTKNNLYLDAIFTHRPSQKNKFFPTKYTKNLMICVSNSSKNFSTLITDKVTDIHFMGDTQCFPLYYYNSELGFSKWQHIDNEKKLAKHEAVSDYILNLARRYYSDKIQKIDIFYYVYGFLHSNEYKNNFANDLKKSLPRIPLLENEEEFWKFSKAGRDLADLHLNYENQIPLENIKVLGDNGNYYVKKMKFANKDKSKIIFNEDITIENIPPEAYEYIINGKSAIEWIMDRYQIKTDKDSQIKNDPNDWCEENNSPKYILNLLLSVITLSVKTIDIVKNLPKIEF